MTDEVSKLKTELQRALDALEAPYNGTICEEVGLRMLFPEVNSNKPAGECGKCGYCLRKKIFGASHGPDEEDTDPGVRTRRR